MRKADDKHLLVEIELVQCKIYHSLENLPKSKVLYYNFHFQSKFYKYFLIFYKNF